MHLVSVGRDDVGSEEVVDGQAVGTGQVAEPTAEDLEGASFAGQQDIYLDVVGADALLDADRRCWASLWTDRAVSYRASNGIDPAGQWSR
ncbi:MAG TPA: PEP/pyruvate-binding domain-containing protein [Microlunatus sp.]|nr:PEP/pyruvate-binding domain-containing protein [Microlunatus sp.]